MRGREPCECGSLFFRRWHLIRSKRFGVHRMPTLLSLRVFDLETDGEEEGWLNAFLPDLILQYRFRKLERELQATGIEAWERWTGGASEVQRIDPEVRERLKALGYVQ